MSKQQIVSGIVSRAATLFTKDGYKAEQWFTDPARYDVVKPDGGSYMVNLKTRTCTCKACRQWNVCKHVIALEVKIAAGI